MKYLLCTFLFVSFSATAQVISFVGPCDPKPLIEKKVRAGAANVGALTVKFLKDQKIAFEGNERGLHTVYGTPVGNEALEVISDTEMRAYGWCYFVDDLGPDVFPDEYTLDSSNIKVEWIFGFAHYKDGNWISTCTPAFTIRPKFLCE